MPGDDDVDIAPSELGTKSYWDSRYELELHNFEECGDEGEIWFGKSAEKRIIDFVTTHVSKSAPILDLGCGNGSVLRRLLAKRVSEEDEDASKGDITFEYSVVLDKGTWDAMSLSNDRELRLCAYKTAVKEALCCSGKFVIFSCNFTKEELCKFFVDGTSLVFHSEIPAAHTISFGGRQGVTSTGVVFERT
ncbi:hypothetical protein COOONC_18191 [Cooperia oncophora]